MKTIEELAHSHATRITEELIHFDTTLPAVQRDVVQPMADHLLTFLSAVHAGPLKGVEERLRFAHRMAKHNPFYLKQCADEAEQALALLQSVKKP